jgi:hypothetical protein
MIGRIILEGNKVAEMGDDGIWTSTDEALAQHLNTDFSPAVYTTQRSFPFGVLAVLAAAFELEARVEWMKPAKPD